MQRLEADIGAAMRGDRARLRRLAGAIRRAQREGRRWDRDAARFRRLLARSAAERLARERAWPSLRYPEDLPITAHRARILAALREHPVVVVCGATGSGKSTQLPKMLMELGCGLTGWIGHTQPRRIAARALAARLAFELGSAGGGAAAYKIRFTDTVGPGTYVKVLTDGMLLAETRSDRLLERYDAILLDEAHERSLNIDFLLGYLKRLLARRRHLRVIIASATLDADRFAEHFGFGGRPAPVVEVSGRSHPVETRHWPLSRWLAEGDADGDEDALRRGVTAAVEALCGEGAGDILVFLPTERHIRDAAKLLRGWAKRRRQPLDVLPLYARLPAAEQQRVFAPGGRRRVVLATNVAESSLTVPRIRHVVDAGTARISRYSRRSRVVRLPIEPISRASADQRRGRCGRTSPGVCIRLYSEDDYLARPAFATPEIRRTNLAAVILQMLALELGDPEKFPFLDPPRTEAIRHGYQTLFELGAVDEHRRLTGLGRRMSRLPVDPRIARMILAAAEEDCLEDVLILAAALETQDPRERPADRASEADAAHARFGHEQSDFMAYLRLWDFYDGLQRESPRAEVKRACRAHFLAHHRMREWRDVHRQLRRLAAEAGLRPGRRRNDYGAIHRSLLAGLLSHIAVRCGRHEYRTAGGGVAYLWPGSTLFRRKPQWLLAAEALETNRRYLRTAARIDPRWIEPLAEHLVDRSYTRPRWSRRRAAAVAEERVRLFGLTVRSGRQTPYAKVDRGTARRLFIQHGLVEGQMDSRLDFLVHNRELIQGLARQAARTRQPSLLVSDAAQYAFYDERLPAEVADGAGLRRWARRAGPQGRERLRMRVEDVAPTAAPPASPAEFPDRVRAGGVTLPASYRFSPGEPADGVTLTATPDVLSRLDPQRLEWLVPGLLVEKLVALIRSLPKDVRRAVAPAAKAAQAAAARMAFGKGPFLPAAAAALSSVAGEWIAPEQFALEKLPPHLRPNVRVVDEQGTVIAEGRDVARLQRELGVDRQRDEGRLRDPVWDQDGVRRWGWRELPRRVELRRGGCTVDAYPTLLDCGDSVALRLLDDEAAAQKRMRGGVRRLLVLLERDEIAVQLDWLPRVGDWERVASRLPHGPALRRQLADLLADRAWGEGPPPRTREAFETLRREVVARLPLAAQDVAKLVGPLLESYEEWTRRLDRFCSPRWAEAVDEARRHVGELLKPNFLLETPWPRLAHFPRYVKAAAHRLNRLRSGGEAADAAARRELAVWRERYRQRAASHQARGLVDPALEQFRWMLEEYRVSLFAQHLGTAVKVSPQRLERQWERVAW